jgi:hypothetical protein
VPVTAGRRLRDVAGTFEELQDLAARVGDDFLRVTVKVDGPLPGLAERIKGLLPNALDVTVDHPSDEPPSGPGQGSRAGLEPERLFAAYYERRNGVPPSPELQALFAAVYEEASR